MAQKNRKKSLLPQKATKALNHINQNFKQDISVAAVADIVNMSMCSFCRLFKQATGMTFTRCLNLLRLEEAKKLLQTPGVYVFEAAHRAGFRNVNYFRVLFKKYYGCSPREYRDSLQPSPP